jgi:hypothetical protein
MEEHGGGIELLDNPAVPRGAIVRLWFPSPDLKAPKAESGTGRHGAAGTQAAVAAGTD